MNDAEKREKVIKGLECCCLDDEGYPSCKECPYRPCNVRCNGNLCADTLALLKAQEPRVMMLEDIRDVLKRPVWKETKSAHKDLYTGWVIAYDIQTGQGITGERLGMCEPSGRVGWYRLDDYGRTWRCWTSRPSDEQRKEIPWE